MEVCSAASDLHRRPDCTDHVHTAERLTHFPPESHPYASFQMPFKLLHKLSSSFPHSLSLKLPSPFFPNMPQSFPSTSLNIPHKCLSTFSPNFSQNFLKLLPHKTQKIKPKCSPSNIPQSLCQISLFLTPYFPQRSPLKPSPNLPAETSLKHPLSVPLGSRQTALEVNVFHHELGKNSNIPSPVSKQG